MKSNVNGYDSFVWVRKDVIQRIQNGENQRRTNHVTLSNRKSNRDSWQWIRARLIGACKDENSVKKDPSSSPYGNVRLRRVAQDSPSQRLNSPSIINQHIVTLTIEDPEAGPDLNHKSFSLSNSQEDNSILIANSWWSTGGNPPHDLTTLNHLHEPAVVFCLRQRYEMDQIYTYTGRILLALNPFRQIRNLYGQSVMEIYRDPHSLTNKPAPHVYATAQDAYSSMLRDNQNQSILVSGESGAGKTVTTKIILGYLTTLSKWKANESFGVTNGGIESQVVHSNPVLESFGNARTLRNDNSSRFGKFLDVRFHTDGRLKSASIQTYLLEKVRLVAPGFGERNYHIFYELLTGLSPKERNEMGLADRQGPRDFHITAVSGTFDRRDGVEDRATYRELRTALTTIGISDQETKQLFSVCCAILHCSNINFLELPSGASDVDPQNPAFRTAIKLMGVAPEVFSKSLCCSSIEAGGEVLFKTLTQVQAAKALEGLIKATYTAMFQRLVDRINLKLSQPQTSSQNHSSDLSIGVLDIFGFESFDKNSFEQLCINYCNEALQQQFNQFVFKQEQAEYEKENINWEFIAFPDNQDVLDLIEKKHDGILSILDEQNLFPRCTDQTLARAIYEKCSNHPRFSVSSNQKTSGDFCIDHYAGIVEYSTTTFLEKNRDELPKETTELLQSSNISFIASLGGIFANSRNQSIQGDRSRTLRRMNSTLVKESVGSQFSGQLRELREKIAMTSPHYVRCLKPNDLLVPGSFSSSIIAEQLRYAGVLEVIRVSRVGFSQRYPHLEFISRYQILVPNRTAKQRRNYDPRDMCEKVVTAVVDLIRQSETKTSQDILNLDKGKRLKYNNDDVGIQMGRTKVFLRHFAFECLEFMRNRLLQDSAVKLQALWRMIMTRTRFLTMLASAIVIQGVARRLHSLKIVSRARGHKMATIIQAIWRGFVAERRFFAAFLIAIWCQRFYRGMIARELCACKFLEAKILLIQRSWRGFRSRLWLWHLSQATLTIQMAIRSFFACKRLRALRREARDVESIKKQRDLLREEVIRLKKEIENTKGKSSYRGDSDADEVMRLKSELAQLKWKLFGSSIHKDSHDKSEVIEDMESLKHGAKPLLASPFPHDLKGDSWQNIVGRHDEAPSIASDCSFMNRSLLDEAEEPECESQNDNMQVSNNENVSDTNEMHYVLDKFHGDSLSNHSLAQIEAFHHAITTNDTSSFSTILTGSNSLVHEVNAYGKSPLHLAIATGNLTLVKTLLSHGAVANYQDLDGNTPLLLTNDRDIISLLLHEGKANPDIPNNDGICAIHNAVSRLDIESLKLILQCKANVNVADNAEWRTPLHIACSMKTDKADCRKLIKIVRMLCAATHPNTVDVNFQDKSGNTPLHYVAILEVEGACDLLRILLEQNALPNASNLRAQTPLHLLCHNDALRKAQVMQEMLHNLLFYGADPNLPSHTGCTALHLTLYHHDVDSAVQLMGHGAELHLPWSKPKRWKTFWEDMGNSEVLALDMVSDENELHRILAAIQKPQKLAPPRPWCMHCKCLLGSFAKSLHCKFCGRLVCDSCAPRQIGPDFFPKIFEIDEPASLCLVCEKISLSRK